MSNPLNILVVPDTHAHFQHNNKRAECLGHLITDLRPDVVVLLGDNFDMPSLSSYDKGTKSFQGRSYEKDIEAGCDFQSRLWGVVRRSKRKMPRRVCLIGNHEQRIDRAIELQPELEGVLSKRDLELDRWYDEVVDYDGATPGTIEINGVTFAHYLVGGNSGRPISGERHAHSLLAKMHTSCVVGHSHMLDYATRTRQDGTRLHGLVAGVYQDYKSTYAGTTNNTWWKGVCYLKNVEKGDFDLQTISLDTIKKNYRD